LHPYQPPLACALKNDCLHCQGFICPKDCKKDSGNVFLKPALEKYNATIIDECCVIKLQANETTIKQVVCKWKDNELTLRGKLVILAAGALESPNILLNSKSDLWPNGLANNSNLIGKNLMRNFYDLYFIFPKRRKVMKEGPKEIYLTDFYTPEAGKLGIIQSFGHLSPHAVVEGIENDIENSLFRFIKPIFKMAKPFLIKLFASKFSSAFILVSTMEDLPYIDNKVIPASSNQNKIAIQYQIHRYDQQRIAKFRKKIKQVLKPYKFFMLKQAEQNKNFIALACGTCRMGNDALSSVLNADNKAHDIKNLYIVDSSFFPSNPGLNSGLTVAANAIRVARKILTNQL
ncbi:MAG: GMC oxidoreductase, partial [Methylococcales bacterium]